MKIRGNGENSRMELRFMINVGFFSEMKVFADNGSITEYIVDEVNYNKSKMLNYLETADKKAICPRNAIDCVSGDIISPSFAIYDDGEFCWGDFLLYHIRKYNIKLPQELINKAKAKLIKTNN
jgi:hypothetical protein